MFNVFENKNKLIREGSPKRKVHRYFKIQTGLFFMGEKGEIRWNIVGFSTFKKVVQLHSC